MARGPSPAAPALVWPHWPACCEWLPAAASHPHPRGDGEPQSSLCFSTSGSRGPQASTMIPSQCQGTCGVPKAPSLFLLLRPICTIRQVLETVSSWSQIVFAAPLHFRQDCGPQQSKVCFILPCVLRSPPASQGGIFSPAVHWLSQHSPCPRHPLPLQGQCLPSVSSSWEGPLHWLAPPAKPGPFFPQKSIGLTPSPLCQVSAQR